MLKYKNCIECNSTIFTLSTIPYCKKCMKLLCCMSTEKNVLGYIDCNCTFNPICHSGRMFCLGHYKQLKNMCRLCKNTRNCNDKLSFDMWYYCDKHKPSFDTYKQVIFKLFRNKLNTDVIEIIFNKLSDSINSDIDNEMCKKTPKEQYNIL